MPLIGIREGIPEVEAGSMFGSIAAGGCDCPGQLKNLKIARFIFTSYMEFCEVYNLQERLRM